MNLIKLIFGHHSRDGTPLPVAQIAAAEDLALTFFSHVFGGGQVYVCRHIGGYRAINGELTTEPCSIVSTFAPAMDEHLAQSLWSLASSIAQELDQECVLLAITRLDGTLEFVTPMLSVQAVQSLHAA